MTCETGPWCLNCMWFLVSISLHVVGHIMSVTIFFNLLTRSLIMCLFLTNNVVLMMVKLPRSSHVGLVGNCHGFKNWSAQVGYDRCQVESESLGWPSPMVFGPQARLFHVFLLYWTSFRFGTFFTESGRSKPQFFRRSNLSEAQGTTIYLSKI